MLATRDIPIVLLTGSNHSTQADGDAAGAEALVRKPFSPLELLAVANGSLGASTASRFARRRSTITRSSSSCARDIRHLLEIERAQRVLLQKAYQETVSALASALESKDTGTRAHSQRVQRYAIELAAAIEPALAGDQSTLYGFLLHDVGKIGIPTRSSRSRAR